MAKVEFEVPDKLLEETAKQRINYLEKQLKNQRAYVSKYKAEIKQLKLEKEQNQKLVEAARTFLHIAQEHPELQYEFGGYC